MVGRLVLWETEEENIPMKTSWKGKQTKDFFSVFWGGGDIAVLQIWVR